MGNRKDSLQVKGSVSDHYDRPIRGAKVFGVRKHNTVILGTDTYRRPEVEKILWYLVDYIGAEKVFKKLAEKLNYEVEK